MSSEDANLALVIRRNKFEPFSRRNLRSFLSVIIRSVSGDGGESRKIAAAKLVFSPSALLGRYRTHTGIPIKQRSIVFTQTIFCIDSE